MTGDLGVYMHSNATSAADVNATYSEENTSAGGTKMGETLYWDEFAKHDAAGNIIGDKTGNFANPHARIHYGVSADNFMDRKLSSSKAKINSFNSANAAKNWLQTNSARGAPLDIKKDIGEDRGYLFQGKYVSGESLGNYLFGANLNALREFSVLDNLLIPVANKYYVFDKAARAFGAYHNASNGVNNPSVAPYYGEIPYSGRQIVHGYYGSYGTNPIFADYKNAAIFGNLRIK